MSKSVVPTEENPIGMTAPALCSMAPICYCGLPSLLRKVKTSKNGNDGRNFWGCSLFGVGDACGLFEWVDECNTKDIEPVNTSGKRKNDSTGTIEDAFKRVKQIPKIQENPLHAEKNESNNKAATSESIRAGLERMKMAARILSPDYVAQKTLGKDDKTVYSNNESLTEDLIRIIQERDKISEAKQKEIDRQNAQIELTKKITEELKKKFELSKKSLDNVIKESAAKKKEMDALKSSHDKLAKENQELQKSFALMSEDYLVLKKNIGPVHSKENCVICLERLPCIVTQPCLHMKICTLCAAKLSDPQICPYCRVPIFHKFRVYW